MLIQKRGILWLLSAPARYTKRKIENVFKKLGKQGPKKLLKHFSNILENEVHNEENLKRNSIDELKRLLNWEKSKIGVN